jgi:putative hemolysin
MLCAAAVGAILVASCGSDDDQPSDPTTDPPVISGVPNPATVFCAEHGGTTSGPEPMCNLPDGTSVDAWEYYRAETG